MRGHVPRGQERDGDVGRPVRGDFAKARDHLQPKPALEKSNPVEVDVISDSLIFSRKIVSSKM